LAIVKPVTEKNLSDGADVAGIAKTFLAMTASKGYCYSFSDHQSNGLLKQPSF